MSRGAGASPRLAAVRLLAAVLDRGQGLSDAEAPPGLEDPRDRAFARHLAYGVLRWYNALDWLAGRLLQRPLKRRDRDVHRLVLVGLFQLWRDEAPDHAAVHEAAEAARALGKAWAVGLVNAVLRRFLREQGPLLQDLNRCDERFAHPPWLLAALRSQWPLQWEGIVAANNQPAPLWLRVRHGADRDALHQRLAAAGLAVRAHPHAADALAVEPAVAVEALPGFLEGQVSVQDPAAQLAAGLLDVRPGQRVLDACAAPGGKACHLLERQPDIALTALDASDARLGRVRENLERLGLADRPGLSLAAADAAEPEAWWDGKPFQRILLDAPCSATGVIRRHPDIKWLRRPEQVPEASRLQRRLLGALWPLLEPGGILVYATCSVLHEENRDQVEDFLERHPDAAAMPLASAWGTAVGAGRQILPGQDDMDGFYYARLRKH